MRSLAFAALLLPAAMCHAEWTPPDNPDPWTILHEAQADARAGHYAVALAKHIWYHENALQLGTGQGGVRLSFALGYWHDLGKKYPPALEAMKATREAADASIDDAKGDVFQAFHDFSAINQELGDDETTLQRFLALDEDAPRIASKVYHVVEPLLVKAKHYDVCGRYLRPEFRVDVALSGRKIELEIANGDGTESKRRLMRSEADDRLSIGMGRLVALLVLNDRVDEAEEIAKMIRPELMKKRHLQRIEDALEGTPPQSRF